VSEGIERRLSPSADPSSWEAALREWAAAARAASYAPYSAFAVGAAVLAGSGRVYLGANVENASYGLSVCAERVAVFAAAAAGERCLLAAAVDAGGGGAAPCGACRQVLAEFMAANAPVWFVADGNPQRRSVGELLPAAFSLAPSAPCRPPPV
jgi:cytidine deaminase